MPTVSMTSNLYRFFPQLKNREITVPAGSVAEIVRGVDAIATGFSDYVLDDHGALRRHVHISVNNKVVVDRKSLSDQVPSDGNVYIFQSLTGG